MPANSQSICVCVPRPLSLWQKNPLLPLVLAALLLLLLLLPALLLPPLLLLLLLLRPPPGKLLLCPCLSLPCHVLPLRPSPWKSLLLLVHLCKSALWLSLLHLCKSALWLSLLQRKGHS